MNYNGKWEGNYILLYNNDGVHLMNNIGKWEENYLLLYNKESVNLMINNGKCVNKYVLLYTTYGVIIIKIMVYKKVIIYYNITKTVLI
jgi:hypothetical protein